jgi:TolB-like protein
MAEQTELRDKTGPAVPAPKAAPPTEGLARLWARITEHKLIQAGVAYFAAAIAIAHAEELIAHAYHWPARAQQILIGVLALGFPVTLGVAWLSGRKRVRAGRPASRALDLIVLFLLAALIVALIGERFFFGESQEPSRIIIVAIGALVVFLIADRLVFSRRAQEAVVAVAPTPVIEAASIAAAPQDERVSLAVLPFADMSPGKDQEYFSDGLSEELLNQLAQLKGLRVAARTSCFAFKGQNPDLKQVSEKLGVAHVLEGSVRKAGNRLRITAQLINAADGYHLWSNTFDRELDDVFAIQEDIARAVAEALKITLGMNKSTLTPGGTRNVEAYDLFLRAQALARQGNAQGYQRAIALLRQAVELDPRFAMAWAYMGGFYVNAMLYSPETAEASRKLSDEAFERAMACAPDAWMIHEMQAYQLFLLRRDFVGSERAMAKAKELAPSGSAIMGAGHPFFLACVGRTEEAIKAYQTVVRADPLVQNSMLQFALDSAGRYEEAAIDYKRTLTLPADPALPEYFAFLRAFAREGSQSAKVQLKRYLALNDGYMPVHHDVLAKFDDKKAVLALVRKAFEEPFYQDTSHMNGLAHLAAEFGDDALALTCLRRAFVDMRAVAVAEIWHPSYASLRKTEGFKQLVRDLGLYDYWRTTGHWPDFAKPKGDDDFEIIR